MVIKFLTLISCCLISVGATANGNLPSLPTSPEHDYTLIISTFGVEDKDLQKMIVDTFIEGLTQIGSKAIVASDMKDLQISFKGLSDGMLSTLGKINSRLPKNKEAYLNVYYVPILKKGLMSKSKVIRDTPIETPAGTVTAKIVQLSAGVDMTDAEFELYTDLSNSIMSHNQYMHEKGFTKGQKPFYFSSVSAQTMLHKDNSGFQLQGLVGFPQGKMEFKEEAPEVKISQLVIEKHKMINNNDSAPMAEAPNYQTGAPVAIMNIDVHQNQKVI